MKLSIIASFVMIFLISVFMISGEIDLREANVMGVQWEQMDNSNWEFSVTLLHDDDGENGFANYWVVETFEGIELGKRILTHAHGNIEFTRSEIVKIPSSIIEVIVRGHDQIHDFGGRVALINLESNTMELVDQGSDRMTFVGNNNTDSIDSSNSSSLSSKSQNVSINLSNANIFGIIFVIMIKNKQKKQY